ncbi:hypothetical protein BDK51DRAFT_39979 [Blyttiomyces helicus]|uniref:Ubiquitin-like domain-containing protein n=1 Tax=Blyttiomyces helicus TaxID=388810 RepID=A0A4P9W5D8_9FUNG|nr:hypothetical protein BDK51DRAFT_39979 [Blyttiomyces helicus]|eukprot:RKO85960.1 hypothetical protein BDK51DRAFT_39979 [Blyttiomyces helicus]
MSSDTVELARFVLLKAVARDFCGRIFAATPQMQELWHALREFTQEYFELCSALVGKPAVLGYDPQEKLGVREKLIRDGATLWLLAVLRAGRAPRHLRLAAAPQTSSALDQPERKDAPRDPRARPLPAPQSREMRPQWQPPVSSCRDELWHVLLQFPAQYQELCAALLGRGGSTYGDGGVCIGYDPLQAYGDPRQRNTRLAATFAAHVAVFGSAPTSPLWNDSTHMQKIPVHKSENEDEENEVPEEPADDQRILTDNRRLGSVYLTLTIADIKTRLNMPYSSSLLLAGKELEDGHTLSYYNIQEGSALCFVRSMQIFVKTLTGIAFSFKVKASDTMANLKVKINNKEGTPGCAQRIIFNGQLLEDPAHSLVIECQTAVPATSPHALEADAQRPPPPSPLLSSFVISAFVAN